MPARHKYRLFRAILLFLLTLAVALEYSELSLGGQLSFSTALPLHLCGFLIVVTPFMLFFRLPFLCAFCLFMGVPASILALLFPCPAPSPHPQVMEGAFLLLHLCLLASPFLPFLLKVYPQKGSEKGAMLTGLLLMGAAIIINPLVGGNYLFLASAPAKTPLAFFQEQGQCTYVCALIFFFLLLLRLESAVVGYLLRQNRTGVP